MEIEFQHRSFKQTHTEPTKHTEPTHTHGGTNQYAPSPPTLVETHNTHAP
eukprot:m.206392 g.206392  ORF g.206392 m.206392 type:complete len:50 (-) comp32951_c1_seq1:114-263(-)